MRSFDDTPGKKLARVAADQTKSFVAWWSFLVAMIAVVNGIGRPVGAQESATVVEPVAIERRPYDIRLLVAFDHTEFDQAAADTVLRDVEKAVVRCAGDMWSLKVAELMGLDRYPVRGLERLDRTALLDAFPEETADVWYAAAVQSLPVGTRISVRSWQPEVQFESVTASADVQDRREVANTILKLCHKLMRPMGIVESTNQQSVRIRLRAGELTPPDPTFVQLSKDDLLIPMLAFRNKENQIERLQSIPWTYVSIEEIDGAALTGTVRSGLRLALGGRRRGRIDTLVVAVRPQYQSTLIELATQAKSSIPLVAHRIEVRTSYTNYLANKDHPEIDPKATLLEECLTDRLGRTRIKADPNHRMVWLFAFSGDHLLARVPFVTGSIPFARYEVPDDSVRLTVEADLQMIQGEVIDAVALRNTAMAAARAAGKKSDWITVNQKLALLRRQEDAGALNDRLMAIRVTGTEAAKTRKDKIGEIRINRICDDTATLIKTHLGEEKIRLLVEEMEQLQKVEKEAQTEQPPEPPKK